MNEDVQIAVGRWLAAHHRPEHSDTSGAMFGAKPMIVSRLLRMLFSDTIGDLYAFIRTIVHPDIPALAVVS